MAYQTGDVVCMTERGAIHYAESSDSSDIRVRYANDNGPLRIREVIEARDSVEYRFEYVPGTHRSDRFTGNGCELRCLTAAHHEGRFVAVDSFDQFPVPVEIVDVTPGLAEKGVTLDQIIGDGVSGYLHVIDVDGGLLLDAMEPARGSRAHMNGKAAARVAWAVKTHAAPVTPETVLISVVPHDQFEDLKAKSFAGHQWMSEHSFAYLDRKFGWDGGILLRTTAGEGCTRTTSGYMAQAKNLALIEITDLGPSCGVDDY